MIRVLQCVNIMDRAGLETMLMNYYRNINRDEIQFDFLTHRAEKGAYEDEIEKLGGYVYHAPRLYPQNYPTYFKWMAELFKKHPEYKIVHSHIDSMSFFPLLAAKIAGVPVRIAHSHSSKLEKDLKLPIKYIALKLISSVTTCNCACGDLAGRFMFGSRNFTIIRNAIDIDKFSFNEQIRDEIREKLGITDKFVIGHVGRFRYIKRQLFLLDVFAKIKDKRKNAYLLLVGNGEDEQRIREKIKTLNLEDYVSLLIDRADVDRLYQAMDVFVMPSLFEGLPLVVVEAQANGLSCVVSDGISKEILLTDSIRMTGLNLGIDKWRDSILNTVISRNVNAHKQLEEKGYSVKNEAKKMIGFYKSLI